MRGRIPPVVCNRAFRAVFRRISPSKISQVMGQSQIKKESNMEFQHEVIFCIVNSGYSEQVMESAKKLGARGGTVLNARGTANKDAETFLGITIQPNKEIVMILVPSEIKDSLLHALYQDVGLNTPGHGIAFALPVDGVVGLSEGAENE